MLFNSYTFIFIFLPTALISFYILTNFTRNTFRVDFLIIISLLFYSWWNINYLFLLIFSIILNFLIGNYLIQNSNKLKLFFGIFTNLLILGYYKYTNFFIENINVIFDKNHIIETIILPLGISYFTFQQITYLVDCYLGKVSDQNLRRYFLYVCFFPQIVTGPIVRYGFLMPQIKNKISKNFDINHLNVGITTFAVGLFKKVVLADNLALYVNPYFSSVESGIPLNFFDAWVGAIGYAFQIYFDFSGYTDMALGIALMFGFILPINFFSPFKAKNISEFWICWHITLSNLVRNYLYFPLSIYFSRLSGIKNFGFAKEFLLSLMVPTLISFALIGLWHGAGWNFILFGVINGFYIIIFNLWKNLKNYHLKDQKNNFKDFFAQLITFLSVVLALIVFRSNSIESSLEYFKAIFGFGKLDLIDLFQVGLFASQPYHGIFWLIISFIIIFLFPNTQEFLFRNIKNEFNNENLLRKRKSFINIKWKPNVLWSIFTVLILITSILFLNRESEFIYLQF